MAGHGGAGTVGGSGRRRQRHEGAGPHPVRVQALVDGEALVSGTAEQAAQQETDGARPPAARPQDEAEETMAAAARWWARLGCRSVWLSLFSIYSYHPLYTPLTSLADPPCNERTPAGGTLIHQHRAAASAPPLPP